MNETEHLSASASRLRFLSGALSVFLLAVVVYCAFDLFHLTLAGSGFSRPARVLWSLLAALLLFLPLGNLYALLQRKRTTGRFLLTPEEVAARRADALRRIGAGKPFRPQLAFFAASALVPLFLLLFSGGLLAFALAICDRSDHNARNLFFGLSALTFILFLLWPSQMLWRKRNTGSFLPAEQEVAKAVARRLDPASRQRFLVPAVYYFNAILFTLPVLHHRHGPDSHGFFSPWLMAVMWWSMAAMWTVRALTDRGGRYGIAPESEKEPPLTILKLN